jgi:hypothetical protein
MSKIDKAMAALERCPRCGGAIPIYARACPACGHELVEAKIATFETLRAHGAISDAAFDEIRQMLLEPEAAGAEAAASVEIRKQVTALIPDDLERFPIWEFALDEEGEEGQDEETLRPRPDLSRADPDEGLFVVRAELVAADGTRFAGFVSPQHASHVGYVQPTIVTDRGQVRFWFGLVAPRRSVVEAAYNTLGKTAAELFPVRYRALVDHGGAPLDGELPAFLHYRSGDDRTLVEVT